ncbi:serpentine type 7TM GPCR chemoreceptor srt domain-containing protein [Ditylenchus destructor]|uniref:Serpentine type 7TM GPCR chemoreceptor srt domain-containing protein n=1 Tax=Ditylenchus destructor TaxID=166010 RepID=A0AAD4MIL3_9BILA|nr:serpentine type 7TM GPCR chemoreceptor srt domain-containing protein [Ditylenchus destructor]
MSLYTLIFKHDEFQRYYNCSTYDVNEIPVDKRRNIGVGFIYIGIGIFIEVIYLPCLWAIWRLMDKRDFECYRLMFVLGVIDCSSVVVNAFLVGFDPKVEEFSTWSNVVELTKPLDTENSIRAAEGHESH